MKNILITGGTDGIGKATAYQLIHPGDSLTIVGRDPIKGEQVASQLAADTGATVQFEAVDMSLMSAVDQFAGRYLARQPLVDVLLHSAGVIMPERVLTAEALEVTFATQFLSRYLLTEKLLPGLVAAGQSTLLFVSSGRLEAEGVALDNVDGQRQYRATSAMQTSSQALALYTLILMRRYPGLRVYNYGPGLVRTSLGRTMPPVMNLAANTIGRLFSISSEQAGAEITDLVNGANPSGFYRRGLRPSPVEDQEIDQRHLHAVRETSEQLIRSALVEQATRTETV